MADAGGEAQFSYPGSPLLLRLNSQGESSEAELFRALSWRLEIAGRGGIKEKSPGGLFILASVGYLAED